MSELDRAANPTIEEAIKYLERMLFTQDFNPSTLRAKAVNTMAIEALREKAERNKGCRYCNTTHNRYLTDDIFMATINSYGNEQRILTSNNGVQYKTLGFCPSCGRRLEVEP